MGENTKQMQGIGMAGIDLQNLSIEPYRFVSGARPGGVKGHQRARLECETMPLVARACPASFRPGVVCGSSVLSKLVFPDTHSAVLYEIASGFYRLPRQHCRGRPWRRTSAKAYLGLLTDASS
jgi:hypothetical protein